MEDNLTIKALRAELKLSLAEFAVRIGVKSRGYVSMIERGGPCSVAVALAIEAVSGGRIPAASLNSDVALVDSARAEGDHGGIDMIERKLHASGNGQNISTAQVSA